MKLPPLASTGKIAAKDLSATAGGTTDKDRETKSKSADAQPTKKDADDANDDTDGDNDDDDDDDEKQLVSESTVSLKSLKQFRERLSSNQHPSVISASN
eukprot:3353225-Prymnesium_polylepis.1